MGLTKTVLPIVYVMFGGLFLALAICGGLYLMKMFGLTRLFKRKPKIPEEVYEQVALWIQEGFTFTQIAEKISKFNKKTQEKYINAYLEVKKLQESP